MAGQIAQRLVLIGGYPGAVWTCAWCAAPLTESVITHRGDCAWIAELRAAEQERLTLLADERDRPGDGSPGPAR